MKIGKYEWRQEVSVHDGRCVVIFLMHACIEFVPNSINDLILKPFIYIASQFLLESISTFSITESILIRKLMSTLVISVTSCSSSAL